MIVKEREKPLSLLIMESLSCRLVLNHLYKKYLVFLQKGHAMEVTFDELAQMVGKNVLKFNGLVLQPRLSNAFQWDAIFLSGRKFHLYEIKSAGGEYCYGNELFVSKTGYEMKNPLIQMQENKNNFILFLRELGYHNDFEVEAYSVLLNPNLTLFNLPEEVPILLHSQILDHFEKKYRNAPPLTSFHRKVMEDLLAHQGKPKAFWESIPTYSFDAIKNGVYCQECRRFGFRYTKKFAFCNHCGVRHEIRDIIEGLIDEFQYLFPDRKLTSSEINRLCGDEFSVRRIKKVLNEYLPKTT